MNKFFLLKVGLISKRVEWYLMLKIFQLSQLCRPSAGSVSLSSAAELGWFTRGWGTSLCAVHLQGCSAECVSFPKASFDFSL